MHPQPQGEGHTALLSLRRVGPGFPALNLEEQVVSVGTDRVHAAAQVVGARGPQRIQQIAVPAADVALYREDPVPDAGQMAIRRGHQWVELRHQALAGSDEHLADVSQPLVPHIEGRRDLRPRPPPRLAQEGGALAQARGPSRLRRVLPQGPAPPTHRRESPGGPSVRR